VYRRAFASLLAVVVLPASAQTSSSAPQYDNCDPPQLTKYGYNYSLRLVVNYDRCSQEIYIEPSINVRPYLVIAGYAAEVEVTTYNPCVSVFPDRYGQRSVSFLQALIARCGPTWYRQNMNAINTGVLGVVDAAVPSRRLVSATTAPAPPTGLAAQGLLAIDLNGDGIPDNVTLGANSVVVRLMNVDGSVQSTTQFVIPFAPDLAYSTIVSADFNGDGIPDLAVSDPGNPGSTNGGVAILLGNGDGTFQAAKYFPAGQNPSSIAAADFTGDGKIDLAAASSVGPTIVVLPGNGDGTLGAPVSYGNGAGSQAIPVSIVALDLNGDGLPDLVVANQGFVTVPDSGISVLMNTGSGFSNGFNASLPLPLLPSYLAYSDLNNDGNVDLVAVSSQASALIEMFGNGDGTFKTPSFYTAGNNSGSVGVIPLQDGTSLILTPDQVSGNLWNMSVTSQGIIGAPPLNIVGGAPTGIAVADLIGNGQADAVVTGGSSDLQVLLGQSGVFSAPVGYSLAQPSPMPQAVAIGDMNNDGKPDAVVASAGQPGSPGMVSVLLGNGDGTLKSPSNTQVNQNAQSIALADLNNDGKLDAVVAAYGSTSSSEGSDPGGIVVMLGNGSGAFQSQQTMTVSGLHPEAVAVADVNGDGIPDIAAVMVSNQVGGVAELAVFLGKGDGTFQTARTFPLMTPAGTQAGIVIGDFNGDGKPDIAAGGNGIPSNPNATPIDIMLGDGTGNFKEVATVPTTYQNLPVYLATADINQDGHLDLILAGESDGTYFLGNGDGTFQPEMQLLAGSSPSAVAVTTSGLLTTMVFADNVGAVTAVSLAVPSTVPASATIVNVLPTTVPTNGGTFILTVSGTGFVSGDTVT